MFFRKFVKKYFYILLTIFSIVNLLFLKNLVERAYPLSTRTHDSDSESYQISVSINRTFRISFDNQHDKKPPESTSSHCMSAFSNNDLHLRHNSSLSSSDQNRCSNYLSPNGAKLEDWVTIVYDKVAQAHRFLYNDKYLNANNLVIEECEYATISWKNNDFEYKQSDAEEFFNGSLVDSQKEFFHIKCKSTHNHKYETAYARILHNADKEESHQTLKEQPINVFMLGLDSVSRNLWLNSLPATSDLLINGPLKATLLNFYNVVGDGTPAALIPMLTSKHEYELPDTGKYTHGAKFVDDAYPFIWADFSADLGYATMFAEDWPSSGTFTYRMKGMRKPPVTHYMRFILLLCKKFISLP